MAMKLVNAVPEINAQMPKCFWANSGVHWVSPKNCRRGDLAKEGHGLAHEHDDNPGSREYGHRRTDKQQSGHDPLEDGPPTQEIPG